MSSYEDAPMTTIDWVVTHIIMAVPLLNLVFFVIWAFGSGNRSRVTYCRAQLLVVAIVLAIMAIASLLGAGTVNWSAIIPSV